MINNNQTELSDDMLENVVGGVGGGIGKLTTCPKCGFKYQSYSNGPNGGNSKTYACPLCNPGNKSAMDDFMDEIKKYQ